MSCDVCAGHSSHDCPCCSEQLDVVVCPECGGWGYTKFYAINIHTRKIVEVTGEAYCAMPDDEDVAMFDNKNYCQHDAVECKVCGGHGEVYQDDRGDYHMMI